MTAAADTERSALRDACRSYLQRTLGGDGRPAESAAVGFDRDEWRLLAEQLGAQGVQVDERLGGAGLGLAEELLVHEEMGRTLYGGPYLGTVALTATALRALGGERADDLLGQIAAGRLTAAAILDSDPGAGPMTATRTGDAVMLTGTRSAVVDAQSADGVLVRADDGGTSTLVWVPGDVAGLTVRPLASVDLTRRFAAVSFDRALGEVLGTGETCRRAADLGVARGYLALAAECVGLAGRALEMTVDYVKARHQFGRAIGSFQAVKHRCADMLVRLECARSALALAANAASDPDDMVSGTTLCAARTRCGPDASWITGEAIHLHGGIGFTWEHAAHLYFRRATANQVMLDRDGSQLRALATMVGRSYRTVAAGR